MQQRALEHFARIDARLRQGPAKQVREGQQHVPRIEEQDHEALVRLPREVQLEVSETPHSKRNASPARSSLASISRARRRPHSSCVHPGSKESRTKPANRCGERPCAAYTRSASAPRNGHSALSTLRSRAVKTQAPEEIEEEEEDKGDALMTNSCTRHRRDCLRDPAIPSRRSAQGRRRRGARAEHAKRAQGLERENEGVASGLPGKPSPRPHHGAAVPVPISSRRASGRARGEAPRARQATQAPSDRCAAFDNWKERSARVVVLWERMW